MEDSQFIYIIFSRTNSNMGKFIRVMTHNEYNHVSLALSENLDEMYSFARYHINSPFVGGFVVESPKRYIENNAFLKVCKIPITNEQKEIVKNYIQDIYSSKEKYIYNTLSAVTVPLKVRVNVKHSYTCAEFAVSVLSLLGIANNSKFYSIVALEKMLDKYVIFENSAISITHDDKNNDWGKDNYYIKDSTSEVFLGTLKFFKKLLSRKFIHSHN